ncbi:MAG: hypothetical protein HW421_327 [Ignavibacteria bacterium]|nr:hypothetical protein [Ignavibacteria bacterium]
MFKKLLLPIIIVFVCIQVLDGLFHGVILSGLYQQSAAIWRPKADMDRMMWIIYLSTFLQTIGFVYIYYKLINEKSPFRGLWFGLTFGFTVGVGMGYSTYAMLPMPYALAFSWFIGCIIIYGIAGLVLGLIMKEKKA